ncbi:MAG: polysaccharide deacetylase family protein [Caulobacter sp.]
MSHVPWRCVASALLAAAAIAVPLSAVARAAPERTVAITFDDLPYAGAIGEGEGALSPAEVARLNARVRATLKRFGAPATGFVVEQTAQAMGDKARPALKAWTTGELALGNHGYSHADTNGLDLAGVEQEIVRGEASIRPLMDEAGKPLAFMRFPMNHTGDTREKREGIDALLQRLGYAAAASTIDTSDYLFEGAYRAALRRGDKACAGRIRAAYLRYSATQIDYYAGLNAEVLGYAPPEVALLHLNRLNADVLDDLLTLYAARGYRFVDLETAQRDPAYAAGERPFVSRHGPMWGYRWARERGVKVDGSRETEPPAWLERYARGPEVACADD